MAIHWTDLIPIAGEAKDLYDTYNNIDKKDKLSKKKRKLLRQIEELHTNIQIKRTILFILGIFIIYEEIF